MLQVVKRVRELELLEGGDPVIGLGGSFSIDDIPQESYYGVSSKGFRRRDV